MAQSLSRILIHLVFSTKNREPSITQAMQTELHPYLAAILNKISCPSLRVGGVEDHVHLLFGLCRTHDIAHVVNVLKTNSAKWIKSQSFGAKNFQWQLGYGAFSVSQSGVEAVVNYIRKQAIHHQALTFQDEYRRLLGYSQIQYDERYVWE